MFEFHFDTRGELGIENTADLLKRFPRHSDRAINSALASEGYRMKGILQQAIAQGGVYGEWPKLNPHTGVLSRRRSKAGPTQTIKNYRMVWKGTKGNKKRVRQYKQVITSTRENPLLKFRGGIRYQVDKDLNLLAVGFVNARIRLIRMAQEHAEGFSTAITPKMRKMFFAMGFPVKKGRKFVTSPQRPLVRPVFRREKDNLQTNIKSKYLANLHRYMNGTEKA